RLLRRAILIAVSAPGHSQIALLFDLDGVLVHSMPLHTEAWRQYLASLGIEVEHLERSMHGKRNPELVREWFGGALAEDAVLRHGAAKEQLFRDLMLAADPAVFRVPGLLEFLERHQEMPKAIGSNAELANIDFILDHLGLRRFFQAVVHGHEVTRPKPFPDIYLKAADRLGYPPADCIVFEDSPTGVEAARAAGMRVVGVETTPTDFHTDLRIADFRDPQLESWLQAQVGNQELTANHV
ncbi:MAG: HAD family hydrolase, partial [Bryobacteraceae bacterium]